MSLRSAFGDARRIAFGTLTRIFLSAANVLSHSSTQRMYLQTRLIDLGYAHHGLVKSVAVPFNRGLLRTPWLPMLRVQLRAHFVDREYDFDTRAGGVYVDLGANQGIFSIWAALTRSPSVIIAVEADPTVFNNFTLPNMSTHVPRNLYVALNVGVGAKSEEAYFYSTGLDSGSLDPGTLTTAKYADAKRIKVKVLPLDEIIKDYPKIELLKIDIEGAEWDVLQSCERLADIRFIHVESALKNYDWEAVMRIVATLESHSFRVGIRIETSSRRPNVILNSKSQEIWGYLYLTAEQTNFPSGGCEAT